MFVHFYSAIAKYEQMIIVSSVFCISNQSRGPHETLGPLYTRFGKTIYPPLDIGIHNPI